MLLQNYNVFNANPGRAIGGPTDPTILFHPSTIQNFYLGEAVVISETDKSSFNNGYVPPYSWSVAPKSGGIAANTTINGAGQINFANLAGGLNAVAALTGSGDITNAALALVLSAVATIGGSGDLSANIIGKLEAVATIAGTGDITAALGALASLISDLTGSGDLSADITADGSISADINVTGDLLTTANVGAAVWNALAAAFNDPGTMGELLNAAGGGSSPEIIADIVLRRTTANVEASANGDPISLKSLYGMIAQGVHNTQVSGSTLTVTESDDTTVLGTRTVTTSASAEPIVGIDSD